MGVEPGWADFQAPATGIEPLEQTARNLSQGILEFDIWQILDCKPREERRMANKWDNSFLGKKSLLSKSYFTLSKINST